MPVSNRLLLKTPAEELRLVEPHLEPVELKFKQVLAEPNESIKHFYFVDSGVVSMVNEPDDGEVVEFATVGPEGLAGIHALLGVASIPSKILVQIPGFGRRAEIKQLVSLFDKTPKLQQMLMRYTVALMNQIAQGTSCNRLHEVQERCARWLLQTHDRVEGDNFPLTQEFLSQMLGVHRPTVSVAAGVLQKAGLIEYERGTVTIVNRRGLEAASCSCYKIILREYERLVGA
ncbi:Crp/Fnr family transcriptional regulator [Bradyrhizobium sp. BRP22]|uniref:Crp/Fnr family transcriptional regulator n=1 Tax=Bradyrhizobium sp. BRP22 TaxID=2793821 RepID=UPI001CD6ED7C|nr:Crp/Fnr family transcriptional regulator [Bradyrhizobium sp. BRP22]MCA1453088.1 Crp/Fnr family transcriptional regulator [Bradyrhizobium sp. BRP22]